MAELREKGISLERSGLMHFFWILGFVLYIGIIYFLGGWGDREWWCKECSVDLPLYSGLHQAIIESQ